MPVDVRSQGAPRVRSTSTPIVPITLWKAAPWRGDSVEPNEGCAGRRRFASGFPAAQLMLEYTEANGMRLEMPRKLAAILAADVAGFSRLMGLDEAGTAKTLREHRAAVDPILVGRGGRVFKTTGDGVLVEFPSIVAAVEAAIAVQRLMAERNADVPEDRRMLFRIGINTGDVLLEGDDILGDGVNVAARLEGIAEPGGICVSEDAYRHVQGKTLTVFADAGERQLKNIARPVRIYRVRLDCPSAPVCTENPIRVYRMIESAKLAR
jgi:class 3 adenylate cyclase